MIIIKILYSILYILFITITLATVPWIGCFVSIFRKDRKEFLFLVSKWWSKWFVLLPITRIKIEGLENIPKKTPVIFISNHQSFFDIPMLLAYLPGSFRFIVKKEYFKTPIVGPYTKWSGHLSVDRKVASEAIKTLQQAKDLIKSKKSIIIFPEGSRSRDGKLRPFKRGAFMLAFEANVPIIPLAISNSFKLINNKSFIFFPVKTKMAIGKPIFLKEGRPTKEIYLSTMDFVRSRIEEMMEN